MGMKDIVEHVKVMDKAELEKIEKKNHNEIIADLGHNKILVRIGKSLSTETKKLLLPNDFNEYQEGENVQGVPSCVHIASAIAAYARMSINDYKNISGNPCIMSDTDSVILPKPLPAHLVGNELGQMKLEHFIKYGIFIRKKLYYVLDNSGKEIIKSSGVNPKLLNKSKYVQLLNGNEISSQTTNFRLS